jgi:AAA domain
VWRTRISDSIPFPPNLGSESGIHSALANLGVVFAGPYEPADLLEEVFTRPWDVVVIDTLRAVLRFRDETNNSELAAQVRPWIEATYRTGRTLLGLHHATKAGGEHGRGIAGGHALLAVFDTAVEVDRVFRTPPSPEGFGLGPSVDPGAIRLRGHLRWAGGGGKSRGPGPRGFPGPDTGRSRRRAPRFRHPP